MSFTDPRLCAAIVDRLTFDWTISEAGSTSYRLAHARDALGASHRGATQSVRTGATSS
jgi:hypothetical protein